MSYDIQFLLPRAGLTTEQLYEAWCEEQENETSTHLLTGLLRRKIADDLLATGLGLDEFQKDFDAIAEYEGITRDQAVETHGGIELSVLEGDATGLQIEIEPAGVSLAIPYWDMPEARVTALKTAFEKIFAVLKGAGLVGYDPQFGREANIMNFLETVATVTSTRAKVVAQIGQKKPWWKFW